LKKVFLFLLALFLAAGIAVHADAAMHGKSKGKAMGMGKGMDKGMMCCCMGDENPLMMKLMSLGLDDKQKEAMQVIHMNMRKDEIRRRADIGVAEIELKEILMKDPVDLNAAEAKLKQIEALKTGLTFGHIKTHEEARRFSPLSRGSSSIP